MMPKYHALLLGHSNGRIAIYRFTLWLTRLMNLIDSKSPQVLYLLPESIVEIPFEIFRLFKRGQFPLYESEEEIKTY